MEDSLNSTSILLVVLSVLNPKAFSSYIASILLLSIDIGFLFKGIIKKIKLAILLKELVRI